MPTPRGDFHQPDKLRDKHGFDEKYHEALELVKDGVPAKDACMAVFDILERKTWYNWVNWAKEDLEDGYTEQDSNLIKLILGLSKQDIMLHRNLSKTAIDMAIKDKNPVMTQFLLKTKYGYTEKTKQEVEFNNDDDTPIKFEIVDMRSNDEEE